LAPATALAQTSSSSTADSLFGFELQLNFKPTSVGGQAMVATDLKTAEALVEVFERRIPAAKRLIENQGKEIDLLKENVRTATRALSLAESAVTDAEESRDAWKQAAKTQETSLLEDILFSKELWFLGGLAAGALIVKLATD
jgi:hypothetical protein